MCGIGGGISFKSPLFESETQQTAFASPMQFRGPDATGYWNYSQEETSLFVSFVHRRLSIIDLTDHGNQPMHSNSGKLHVVLNGEIYNYQALRAELSHYPFRTQSDTEVLLAGYEAWGFGKLLNKIRGMYAIALFDEQEGCLYLARDPFGKKPLYLYERSGTYYFSSDLRSFSTLGLPLSLNHHSLGYFLSELSTPRTASIWNEVSKVPEGHYCKINAAGYSLHKHWQLTFGSAPISLPRQDILQTVDDLFTKAVQRRLVADVPVGVMLSGGIDSSLVVAKMAQLQKEPVHTYSVGFTDAKANELPFARMVAEKYQTQHTELIVGPEDLLQLDQLILEYGEPFADLSMVPSYLISKKVAEKEKVVLGGDGGDELFAGYYIHFFVQKLLQYQSWKPLLPLIQVVNRLKSTYSLTLLTQVLSAAKQPHFRLLNRKMGIDIKTLATMTQGNGGIVRAAEKEHQAVWENFGQGMGLMEHLMTAILHTRLVNDYLVKVDRASMFASLEMRSPFLDQDLAEYASQIPWKEHFTPYGPKSILRQLGEKYLPTALVNREKQGFSVPAKTWFQQAAGDRWSEVVLGGKQPLIPLDYAAIETYFQEHQAGKRDHTLGLWAWYTFHVWAQNLSA